MAACFAWQISKIERLRVQLIRRLQPVIDVGVDVRERRNRDAVGDAVALGEAAGVEQPAGCFRGRPTELKESLGAYREGRNTLEEAFPRYAPAP